MGPGVNETPGPRHIWVSPVPSFLGCLVVATFARSLNAAGVVAALSRSPRVGGLLLTVVAGDSRSPLYTDKTLPVAVGPDFPARAEAAVAARTKEVFDRAGIAEAFVVCSDAGQVQVRVFGADRSDSAVWVPFPCGPVSGSWL